MKYYLLARESNDDTTKKPRIRTANARKPNNLQSKQQKTM